MQKVALELARLFFYKMPKSVYIILAVTVAAWGYTAFKHAEAHLFPIITDFAIEEPHRDADEVHSKGSSNKVRDCCGGTG